MILKKTNAVLSLISAAALLLHMGYNAFAYMAMYYNPTLKVLTAVPFITAACLHAVCGMCAVFLLSDGTRLDIYPRKNAGTVIQRVSAAAIFPLLILHLRTFELLTETSGKGEWVIFGLLILAQIIFYAVVVLHTAVSFSKAFVTLGLLTDVNKKKKTDIAVYIISGAVLLISVIAVVRGDLIMFLPK